MLQAAASLEFAETRTLETKAKRRKPSDCAKTYPSTPCYRCKMNICSGAVTYVDDAATNTRRRRSAYPVHHAPSRMPPKTDQ